MCKENQKWMDEVPKAFAISDIQSSPIGDERSSVCQLLSFVIWETLLMEMVERILLLQLESEMDG